MGCQASKILLRHQNERDGLICKLSRFELDLFLLVRLMLLPFRYRGIPGFRRWSEGGRERERQSNEGVAGEYGPGICGETGNQFSTRLTRRRSLVGSDWQ
jgi:hypothetical protein